MIVLERKYKVVENQSAQVKSWKFYLRTVLEYFSLNPTLAVLKWNSCQNET